jgi:hypothetical protein
MLSMCNEKGCTPSIKHQKCLSLLKVDEDYIDELKVKGIDALQLFRLVITTLRTRDENKKRELSYFLDTTMDDLLKYSKSPPKKMSLEWRAKWNDKR